MGLRSYLSRIAVAAFIMLSVLGSGWPARAQTVPQDATFFEATRERAEAGDADAQNLLGALHQFGSATAADPEAAFQWYARAADQGHPGAQVNLAALHMEGHGTVQDFDSGVALLRNAAAQGLPIAIARLGAAHMLGQGVAMDRVEGLRLLHQASDLGDGYAAYQIGLAHLYGYGMPVDQQAAVGQFRLSAERGYAVAQAVYAQYAEDPDEQIAWYARAAHAGNGQAQYALGRIMLDAASPQHDPDMAVRWLRLAADNGQSGAEQVLFQMGLPGAGGRLPLNAEPFTTREWTEDDILGAVTFSAIAFGVAIILLGGEDTRPQSVQGDCQPGGPCGGMCPFGHVSIGGICVFDPPRF